ncbi:MAG: TRAP transporter fused permease subunit [Rhodospirillaceae bacterium]|nr:TRAP transporter fused permease subunit [Rhodospirillaceae bacterium]
MLQGWQKWALYWFGAIFVAYHILNLNVLGIETWAFRISHIAGGLVLGFLLISAWTLEEGRITKPAGILQVLAGVVGGFAAIWALAIAVMSVVLRITEPEVPDWAFGNIDVSGIIGIGSALSHFGFACCVATVVGIGASWAWKDCGRGIHWADVVLAAVSLSVGAYFILALYDQPIYQNRFNVFPSNADFWAGLTIVFLILELTRRVAGLALVIISSIFVAYVFAAPYLPGILAARERTPDRVFAFLFSDAGILGPPIAVSSTYIILFITFAAFLQASKVGDYFVNFAFAAAGRARGGPAKVAVFASALMGMINGTSAGNVVATGSLTIPLMKRVGYRPKMAASVEAAASTGGQIMPPIMGAGAFIMAEITGIPYTELVICAIIPAVLYFVSVYFMVDFEALKMGMRGMRADELPVLRRLAKQIYLFIPVVILITTLFFGYSVIRAGTLSMIAAVVVSWLTPRAFRLFAVQILAICAVGLIALVCQSQEVFPEFASNFDLESFTATTTGLIILAVVVVAVSLAVCLRLPQMFPIGDYLKCLGLFIYEGSFLRWIARAFGVNRELSDRLVLDRELPPTAMGWRRLTDALDLAAKMSIQMIAVCAAAGIIVGVISLTGIGAKFSSLLLSVADQSELLALFFAMFIAMLLGMGMPTTAAYAVAASVVAPGLVRIILPGFTEYYGEAEGEVIAMLVAHFFVFYFAVISAITPPVALAAYAGAAIAGSNPMSTSVTSFKLGLAAYIVPFMFFYSREILMVGEWYHIVQVLITGTVGVYFMSAAVQGWFMGRVNILFRAAMLVAALLMIAGGILTDAIGVALAAAVAAYQIKFGRREPLPA